MERSVHTLDETLSGLEDGLRRLYGCRYRGLVLYGSHARGEADEGSDVDLLLLLSGMVQTGNEIRRASELVSRFSLESEQVLSVIPVSAEDYHYSAEPYLRHARREGRLLSAASA